MLCCDRRGGDDFRADVVDEFDEAGEPCTDGREISRGHGENDEIHELFSRFCDGEFCLLDERGDRNLHPGHDAVHGGAVRGPVSLDFACKSSGIF